MPPSQLPFVSWLLVENYVYSFAIHTFTLSLKFIKLYRIMCAHETKQGKKRRNEKKAMSRKKNSAATSFSLRRSLSHTHFPRYFVHISIATNTPIARDWTAQKRNSTQNKYTKHANKTSMLVVCRRKREENTCTRYVATHTAYCAVRIYPDPFDSNTFCACVIRFSEILWHAFVLEWFSEMISYFLSPAQPFLVFTHRTRWSHHFVFVLFRISSLHRRSILFSRMAILMRVLDKNGMFSNISWASDDGSYSHTWAHWGDAQRRDV